MNSIGEAMPTVRQLDEVIALLAARFPSTFVVFQERRKPLKLSIHRDIAAAVGAIQHLKPALACYTSNIAYLWALKARKRA